MAHILIVGDQANVRTAVLQLLLSCNRTDLTIDQATNGTDALRRLQSRSYDLMISDTDMPGMNGDELMRAVRADEKLKRLPVILACFILLSAAALAAGVSVTLNASDNVEIQAAPFTAYLDSLNEADQREWQQALQQMLSPDQADAGAADSERLVYITPKGEVYHSTEQCASLNRSKTINSLTLGEAVTNGRRPCKVCAGK